MTREEYRFLFDLKQSMKTSRDPHAYKAGEKLEEWLRHIDVSDNPNVILLQGEFAEPVVMKPGLYRREH